MKKVEFTKEQQDFIFQQIDEWYKQALSIATIHELTEMNIGVKLKIKEVEEDQLDNTFLQFTIREFRMHLRNINEDLMKRKRRFQEQYPGYDINFTFDLYKGNLFKEHLLVISMDIHTCPKDDSLSES